MLYLQAVDNKVVNAGKDRQQQDHHQYSPHARTLYRPYIMYCTRHTKHTELSLPVTRLCSTCCETGYLLLDNCSLLVHKKNFNVRLRLL